MKILLVSDSHGDYESLDRLAKMYPNMDLYLHAGDSEQDEWSIKPFVSVRGNCDHYYVFPNYLGTFLYNIYHLFPRVLSMNTTRKLSYMGTHILVEMKKRMVYYI